jgi:hypothetical protein
MLRPAFVEATLSKATMDNRGLKIKYVARLSIRNSRGSGDVPDAGRA